MCGEVRWMRGGSLGGIFVEMRRIDEWTSLSVEDR